ncbi:MAG: methyltransferase domain-containing protein [Omnitrophica WOR_2 bacterium]
MLTSFRFACPLCHSDLAQIGAEMYICPTHKVTYPRKNGVWRFLPSDLNREYQQFMQEYQSIRAAEGRGAPDSTYYRSLPFKDLSGRYGSDWNIRARSFQSLLHTVVAPLEKKLRRPLRVLDLGAGNGWLSYRLAQRGNEVSAVDLQTNSLDGLGAYIHYDAGFLPVQADFNHLPFQESQADLVIFNASFHYSVSYVASLGEAIRILQREGQIVILDSPLYHDPDSGAKMVHEREEHFQKAYGFASNAISSKNYLTYRQLEDLGRECGIRWKLDSPFYGLSWAVRPVRARLAGRREPAQFQVVVGQRFLPDFPEE